MATRARQGLVPIIASLMLIIGLTAAASAGSGLQMPGWGPGQELAGPLGLNPTPGNGVAPISISIPDATVDAEVERNQIVDGVMLDPSGPWVVSWYQETGALGDFSNTVMSGHVDYWDVGPAVFYTVAQLAQGAPIHVTGENGATYTYVVEWIRDYEVAGLTPEAINEIVGPTDYRALTLITCGGEFDYERQEYLYRTVVRAKLVDVEGMPAAAPVDAAIEDAAPAQDGALAIGGSAAITENEVNLRADATTTASVVSVLSQGQAVTIVDGPREAEGRQWWSIALADGTTGWIAAEFLAP
jgi:hypothetical protein